MDWEGISDTWRLGDHATDELTEAIVVSRGISRYLAVSRGISRDLAVSRAGSGAHLLHERDRLLEEEERVDEDDLDLVLQAAGNSQSSRLAGGGLSSSRPSHEDGGDLGAPAGQACR